MTTFAEVRAMKMLGTSAAIMAVPRENWPERGLAVAGSLDVAIVCHHDYENFRDAHFSSFTFSQFHYCPTAKWNDWVRLARRILEVDAAVPLSPRGSTGA